VSPPHSIPAAPSATCTGNLIKVPPSSPLPMVVNSKVPALEETAWEKPKDGPAQRALMQGMMMQETPKEGPAREALMQEESGVTLI
jgi:hypothetical protein